jgi:glycosyltransferase involved in cell wall biosynthesis
MVEMADLSIVAIMPLYNGAQFVEEAILSVLNQTRPPEEFLIIDDGSTDDGPDIVKRFAEKYPITLLRKENGGQSSARNYGVQHSKSSLIALIDQDDRWYATHLEDLIEPFKKPRGMPLGWTYSDFDDIDDKGRVVSRSFLSNPALQNPKRHLTVFLAQGAIIQPSATVISRDAFQAVGGFDERLCGYEDDDLFLRIFRANYDNAFISHSTSQWRIHESSCGASDRNDDSLRYYVEKLLAEYKDDRWRGHYYARDAIGPRFVTIWMQMYIRANRYKNHAKMKEYVREAIKLLPLLAMRKRAVLTIALALMRSPYIGNIMLSTPFLARRVGRWI